MRRGANTGRHASRPRAWCDSAVQAGNQHSLALSPLWRRAQASSTPTSNREPLARKGPSRTAGINKHASESSDLQLPKALTSSTPPVPFLLHSAAA